MAETELGRVRVMNAPHIPGKWSSRLALLPSTSSTHHSSLHQDTVFIPLYQARHWGLILFRYFLESCEKTTVHKMGLQTPFHTSAHLCICAHTATCHLDATESNLATEERKVTLWMCLNWYLIKFVNSPNCPFSPFAPVCKGASISIHTRLSQDRHS